jgi:hypothetical protein
MDVSVGVVKGANVNVWVDAWVNVCAGGWVGGWFGWCMDE